MALLDIEIASWMLWLCALVTVLLDVGVVLILVRRLPPDRLRHLPGFIVLATAIFWLSYGLLLFSLACKSFYASFLPDPANHSLARSLLELLIYPPIGLLMWWLARRLPGNPAVNFRLLGGFQ